MSTPTSRNGSVVLALAGILILTLYFADTDKHLYRMGKAVACRDDSVFENSQAEILEYGLQDVRGLTIDSSGRYLYIAEANRPVLIYDNGPDPKQMVTKDRVAGFINSDHDLICRDSECENVDDRDVAIVGEEAYITENGKGKISLRLLGKDHKLGGWELWDPKWADAIATPSGISVIAHKIFISTDTPSRIVDSAISNPGKVNGALYIACEVGDCQPDLIGDTLQHPSGVVSTGPNGPVYVADDEFDSVRYPIYRKIQGRGWIQDGLLASVPKDGETMPRFLGIAFSKVKKMIFAAGPSGIYAFDVHGASIGRMVFDQPVSGVAVSDEYRYLYLVVGHMLCRIPFDRVIETNKALREQEVIRLAGGQLDPTVPDFDPLLTSEVIKPRTDLCGNKPERQSSQNGCTGSTNNTQGGSIDSTKPPQPNSTRAAASVHKTSLVDVWHKGAPRTPPPNSGNCSCNKERKQRDNPP